ncbi:G5 domain-containing protein [Microbacterium sp. W4I20]|uniref:G5 domain-containing protein n=1 Tax=Microbacterium sp. W4I20 TaxID=3042262 RepID=UPI00278967A6|nr:G5 domain-containing protein [Microbacterium sp. W4I20]MDQ0727245.1 pyruvate/2-oxoglutarate dehydrogenase complex dihydrolipoamide acyltransferase (E2) component [Microbacterium sp. W4I20]
MPETPQGWYADPNQPAQQRWWDGTQWTHHTAPLGQMPVAVAEAPAAKSSKLVVALIIGAVILVITLLTRSLGAILMLAGFVLFFVAIYAIVRGSAKLFRVRSRGAAWAALGIAFVLMFVGTGANAALGGPGSNAGNANNAAEAKPFASTPTEKPSPSPSPKPTTFEEVEESAVIPFERTTVDDANIDIGKTVITTIGVNGTKVTTYRVKYVDGEEVSRELASEAVTVAPVNEVTSNGTRQPAPVPLVQAPSKCDGNYEGVCVPIDSDVDCEGGSGDGPSYIDGPLRVVGTDVYDLDRDGDGIACDK